MTEDYEMPGGLTEGLDYEKPGSAAEKLALLMDDVRWVLPGLEPVAAVMPPKTKAAYERLCAACVPAAHTHDSDYAADTCPICFPNAGPVVTPDQAAEVARLKAELSRVQSAAQTLGKIVARMAQSMEAARIEMIQNGPEAAMQWILNSLPDVSDEAPGDQWDGKETARQWIDRTQAADRAAELEPQS